MGCGFTISHIGEITAAFRIPREVKALQRTVRDEPRTIVMRGSAPGLPYRNKIEAYR
jgi:hypothetical protein